MKTVFRADAKAHRGSRGNLGIKIDSDSILRRDHILLQRTPTGYFCAGFGKSAAILRAIFEEDLGELEKSDNDGHLSRFDDPYLRRLALIGTLTKDYDPDEPRDARGRWTSEGGDDAASSTAVSRPVSATETVLTGPGAAGAAALANIRPLPTSAVAGALAADGVAVSGGSLTGVWSLLRSLVPTVGIEAAALLAATGILAVIPLNRSLVSSGTVQGHPGLGFSFNHDDGLLKIFQIATGIEIFSGRPDAQGMYRDQNGNVIGMHATDGLLVDPHAFPGYTSSESSDEDAKSKAVAQAQAITKDKPQICPDRSEEDYTGRSFEAIMYQSQISKLPPGYDVILNGVRFDGCDEEDGTMLEAKSEGLDKFVYPNGRWEPWFTGLNKAFGQIQSQSVAAGSRMVVWHIARPDLYSFWFNYVAEQQSLGLLENIVVVYTPPLPFTLEEIKAAMGSLTKWRYS